MEKKISKRFYCREHNNRFRIYDRSESFGAQDICIADCSDEWRAKVIVYEMNNGLPYRPGITYDDYTKLKNELGQ